MINQITFKSDAISLGSPCPVWARSNRTETNCYRRFWHPPTEFQFRRVNDPSLRIGSPSAGLSMPCSSCHSKCQSAPCASATQGTTRIKPPPGVPWDAGGGAKAEPLPFLILRPTYHASALSLPATRPARRFLWACFGYSSSPRRACRA